MPPPLTLAHSDGTPASTPPEPEEVPLSPPSYPATCQQAGEELPRRREDGAPSPNNHHPGLEVPVLGVEENRSSQLSSPTFASGTEAAALIVFPDVVLRQSVSLLSLPRLLVLTARCGRAVAYRAVQQRPLPTSAAPIPAMAQSSTPYYCGAKHGSTLLSRCCCHPAPDGDPVGTHLPSPPLPRGGHWGQGYKPGPN